jgi:AcrR family transcriptional regulator
MVTMIAGATENDTEPASLRARKKQATREALSRAALRLALENGPENVRVDDIAAAAGVSPRTYNNYFSSREEAICGISGDRAERIGAALRACPADESLAGAIVHVMMEHYTGDVEPDKAAIAMITSTRALRGEYYKSIIAIEAPLAEAIAERTGTDVDRDLFARVLAAAVTSAIRAATIQWLRRDDSPPFTSVLREALKHVAPMASAVHHDRA